MTFPPNGLEPTLVQELARFARENDIVCLYKAYDWKEDKWGRGFPRIVEIERLFAEPARKNTITRECVSRVTHWGGKPNPGNFRCKESMEVSLFQNGSPSPKIASDPYSLYQSIAWQVTGLGPTYISKLLRFALPSEYGAIDTRIVKRFSRKFKGVSHGWLDLAARPVEGRWYIPKSQSGWPKEYAKWINILRFFAEHLNSGNAPCPHPPAFPHFGLRQKGIWCAADVEMALFSYASQERCHE